MLLLLFAIYNSNALPTPLPVRTDPLGALGHSSLPATSKAQSQPETLPALFIGRAMSQAAQEGAPLPLNHPQITQPIVQARPNGPDNIQFLGTTRDEIAANQASGSGRVAHIGTLPDGHRPMSPAGTQLQTPNPPTYHSLMYNSLRTVVDKLAERIVGNARMSTSLNGPHGHVGPLPPTAIDVRTTIRRQLLERLVHNLGQPDTLRRNPGSAQRIQQVKSLMEQALERSNARRGLQQVLQNAGSPAAAHQPATGTGGVSGTHARFQALTGDTPGRGVPIRTSLTVLPVAHPLSLSSTHNSNYRYFLDAESARTALPAKVWAHPKSQPVANQVTMIPTAKSPLQQLRITQRVPRTTAWRLGEVSVTDPKLTSTANSAGRTASTDPFAQAEIATVRASRSLVGSSGSVFSSSTNTAALFDSRRAFAPTRFPRTGQWTLKSVQSGKRTFLNQNTAMDGQTGAKRPRV